jgi:hypothetical protein
MNPDQATQIIRDKAPFYGEAKGQRIYLEEFRKSLKALLMKDALAMGIEAANAQEREAYSDPQYKSLLKGLAAAVEKEETLKWEIEAARLDVEIWRTKQANERMQIKSHE